MEHTNDRLPIFTERFRKLQGERSNTEFAELLGISRQTVGFYCNGDRVPDAVTLTKIAKKCKVSADWLLGLSNVQSMDKELGQVCNYTGLSKEAVEAIEFDHSQTRRQGAFEIMDFLISEFHVSFWTNIIWNCVRNVAEVQTMRGKLGADIVNDHTSFYKWRAIRNFEESLEKAIEQFSAKYAISHPVDKKAYLAKRKKELTEMLARIQNAEQQEAKDD